MKLLKKAIGLIMILSIMLTMSSVSFAATSEDWYVINGTYGRDDNSQYNNGILSLMYLDNDVLMYEFFIMEGSESEDISDNFSFSGAFYIDENGVGIDDYTKAENVSLTFTLSEDGVLVEQQGDLPMSVAGNYLFVENGIIASEAAAVEILEQLPTAATSLNHNNGEYDLVMAEEMVDGWFYDVKANFRDSGELLAEFYLTSDMSAVYRVDTEMPILIWGSAQSMMDATYLTEQANAFGLTTEDGAATDEVDYVEVGYVTIAPTEDVIKLGENSPITVTIPGMLNYSLFCESSNPELVSVDESGVLTAFEEGEATIHGTLLVDDAEKEFEFVVTAYSEEIELEESTAETTATNATEATTLLEEEGTDENDFNVLFVIIPVGIVILLAVVVLIIKKKNK